MSSPKINIQSEVNVSCREAAKIKEEIKMGLTMHIIEAKKLVSRGAATLTLGKAIRGLAVGVLLLAGTGMYFRMSAANAVSGPTPSERDAILEWQRSYLPGMDRLDDQIAAGLETGNEEYQAFLADEVGNPVTTEK
jgi:hypothetical protein